MKSSRRHTTGFTRARPRSAWTNPRRTYAFVPRLVCLEDRLTLDAYSADYQGIDARQLHSTVSPFLTGDFISIGQVELARPGLPGFDNALNSHPDVVPWGVFRGDAPSSRQSRHWASPRLVDTKLTV